MDFYGVLERVLYLSPSGISPEPGLSYFTAARLWLNSASLTSNSSPRVTLSLNFYLSRNSPGACNYFESGDRGLPVSSVRTRIAPERTKND